MKRHAFAALVLLVAAVVVWWLVPWSWLVDTDGFNPRRSCGTGWSTELVLFDNMADVIVWLNFLAWPAMLAALAARRFLDRSRTLVWITLINVFLACGATHFMDRLVFEWPAYHLDAVIRTYLAVSSTAATFVLFVAALDYIGREKT